MKILVVGAGVTGCFTAARLQDKGADVTLLARGAKADRLEQDGLRLKDGMTGEEHTARLSIVRAPVAEEHDLALVCVQDLHRPSLDELLGQLPGRPIIWYLGNTTTGFDRVGEVLGRDRVLGGFPGVGGTWDDDLLVFADKEKPAHAPFDRLIVGEAFDGGAAAAERVEQEIGALGMNVERYVPIMAWHWSHVAFVIPLAGAAYVYDAGAAGGVADRALLKRTMRCTSGVSRRGARRLSHPAQGPADDEVHPRVVGGTEDRPAPRLRLRPHRDRRPRKVRAGRDARHCTRLPGASR